MIATNVSGGTLPADGRIEISFDRLLLPTCVTRQTFTLQQSGGALDPPTVAYDPVSRVAVITPAKPLMSQQAYSLTIVSPSSATDLNGLRAIDGAELDPASPSTFAFTATDPTGSPPPLTTYVDYCAVIQPIFGACVTCHIAPSTSPSPNYAGLALDSPVGVEMTAFQRSSHGSNTGPMAGMGEPAGLLFAEDMPIIDPGFGPAGPNVDAGSPSTTGDPGHSWLMYKVLMAIPAPSTTDGGAPIYEVACSDAGDACPLPLPPDERQRLAALVLGREMPYLVPVDGGTSVGLPLDQMETLSQWIAGGAPLPATLACQ